VKSKKKSKSAPRAKRIPGVEPVWMRCADIAVYLSCSKATAWRLTRRPDFPEPKKLSHKIVAWERADVDRWRTEQMTRAEYDAAHPRPERAA
jgi:predicted DNA-binding transcriptional regulator AlpA